MSMVESLLPMGSDYFFSHNCWPMKNNLLILFNLQRLKISLSRNTTSVNLTLRFATTGRIFRSATADVKF